jgi:hypothetical protein
MTLTQDKVQELNKKLQPVLEESGAVISAELKILSNAIVAVPVFIEKNENTGENKESVSEVREKK